MAPLCVDPRQIVIAFNRARRQAVLKLVDEIISYMISQLQDTPNDLGPVNLIDGDAPKRTGESGARESTSNISSQSEKARPNQQQPGRRPSPYDDEYTQAARIQRAALIDIKKWRDEFLPKLEEIVHVEDDAKIQAERRKRAETMAAKGPATPEESGNLIDMDDGAGAQAEDFTVLQNLYPPTSTRLTTLSVEDRKEALSCILLLMLSTGKYSAYSRTLSLYLASSLELSQSFVVNEETEIAKSLIDSSKQSQKEAMSAEAEAAKRQEENKASRFWKVGLASVAGAAIIGVTGGLAAPLVAGAVGGILGGVGLGGVASFLGIFWMNGALVGAIFGAYGAKMTGEMVDKYAREVEDFKFIPLNETADKRFADEKSVQDEYRRLRVTIGINGWLNKEEDITKPWRVLGDETEVFALRYEMNTLLELGTAFEDLISSAAWNYLKSEIIKRTVLSVIWAALWPIQLLKMASNVDNPFSRALNRSEKAGELLADALINKVQGERPVTLIGYSNGATVIHSCLKSLADRHAFGIIDSVVLIGTPAPASSAHWRTLRRVVSGKIFNVYSENDLVLGFVHRMHTLTLGLAGLQPIQDVKGVENLDLSDLVSGHLRYPDLTGKILRRCGFDGVHSGKDIEEDDLIKMKHQYAAGEIKSGSNDNDLSILDDPIRESTPQRRVMQQQDGSEALALPLRPGSIEIKPSPKQEEAPQPASRQQDDGHYDSDDPEHPAYKGIVMIDGSDDDDDDEGLTIEEILRNRERQ
ncbi:unnamed protein product [Clonostachys byssicola]|uniref:Membrane protein C6F6.13c n=1 Tax=Clonostachys byssicola TaxID=160290 RepID=A0A9N9UJD6_9HYPO|nr:unnamed protein product [Clonostachys byssicola]